MQSNKHLKFFVFVLVSFLLFGCFNNNEKFDIKIAEYKGSSFVRVPDVKRGLPFFIPKTLSPIWPPIVEKASIVEIPQFRLVDQDSKEVTEQLFLGKKSVVAFIFTSCAGFCPILISKLKTISEKITNSENNTQLIVFSVDPEVDTPEVLKRYIVKHKILKPENWRFITGKKSKIYSLIRETFASEVRKLESENMRKFAHTEHFYIIDAHARLRAVINGTRLDLPERFDKILKQL